MNIPIEIIAVLLTGFIAFLSWVVKVINDNTKAIQRINELIASWQTADKYEEKACDKTHRSIDTQFAKVNTRITEHEKRIIKLEK